MKPGQKRRSRPARGGSNGSQTQGKHTPTPQLAQVNDGSRVYPIADLAQLLLTPPPLASRIVVALGDDNRAHPLALVVQGDRVELVPLDVLADRCKANGSLDNAKVLRGYAAEAAGLGGEA